MEPPREFLAFAGPSLIVAGLLIIIFKYYRNVYSFWPRHGLKGEQPLLPIIGELWDFFTKGQMRLSIERREKYGKIYGYFFMGSKRVVINDPEIVKQIAIKDFDLFPNHKVNELAASFQRNSLVWIRDDQWRVRRALMSPTFTSGKMKRMFKLLNCCSEDLVENLRQQYVRARRAGEQSAEVDLRNTYGMYTMDGISTCCYGIKLKSQCQQRELKHLKYKSKRGAGANSARDSFMHDLSALTQVPLRRLLMVVLLPKALLRRIKFTLLGQDAVESVSERVKRMIELRRNEGASQKHDDLLQLLVDARADDELELSENDQTENHHAGLTGTSLQADQARLRRATPTNSNWASLSDTEILSEAMLLLLAGFETTRSALSTVTYFLAHHPEVQERLVAELEAIAEYTPTALGKHLVFEYDSLTSCQYLDAVVSESLRLFPSVIFTDREVVQDYYVKKYDVTIPKGVQVLFGIYSIHMDPDYWEQPERFDPERFMPGRRETIVSGSYLPFSIGPRHCIGMRFSLMETKLALAKVLMNFKLVPAPGTKYPPQTSRTLGLTHIKNCKVRIMIRED